MAVKQLWTTPPQFVDANGDPYSGALLFFYAAGSSTKQNTYTDSGGGTACDNPITLNSSGYPAVSGVIVAPWGTVGQTYKIGLAAPGSSDPPASFLWTEDSVSPINDTALTIDQWVAGAAPTYVSATSFTLVGDQTSTYHVGRRLKTTNSGGTIYSTIVTSAYGALTTITVVNDSGTLDAGLSAVYYGLLSATNPSTPLLADTFPIVSGSADKTKKLRFEVDGLTTGTTRVLTPPDADLTLPAITAAGDIPYASASGVLTKLAIGTAGQVLRTNAGATAPAWTTALQTSVATTSGTSVTISSAIPAWATKVRLIITGLSTNGTSPVIVQLGTGGSATTTGYLGSASGAVNGGTVAVTNPTDGFGVAPDSAASYVRHGSVVFLKQTGNTWVASGVGGQSDTARLWACGGTIALAGALDFMRITTQGGVDTFDAGAVSVSWE